MDAKLAILDQNPSLQENVADEALAYLSAYGYLAGAVASAVISPIMAASAIMSAVVQFQSVAGLEQTGKLDGPTLSKMCQPRCGCPDILPITVQGEMALARWRKTGLAYCITDFVSSLPQSKQEANIAQAWKDWTDVAAFTAKRVEAPAKADVIMSVGRGRRDNFDGPGGTLAWAYLPSGNDSQILMRFDDGEKWDEEMHLGVGEHEIGHLIGLEHSRVSMALMAPFFNRRILKPQANDDISRIQALYGKPVAPNPVPNPTPPPPEVPPNPGVRTIKLEFFGQLPPHKVSYE